jgi:hypothetical protein
VIRRLFLPLLAVAAIGAVVRASLPDIARYLKMRDM